MQIGNWKSQILDSTGLIQGACRWNNGKHKNIIMTFCMKNGLEKKVCVDTFTLEI